ncbi:MAG TPA: ribosomal L7Ae/L30e/S12e/Gadd45 family protein [Gemmatimonadaceae bacterium]|jgi:ribosomal protein L7Ae-like RNA K-turn-binding protein|nr:ribosomal L7Ae/L30e/S12e/Gadd45 family protein [Gemmatimonadaceae bacterium]
MEAVVRRKILGLVGLGIRGRLAVVGVQQVRDAAKRGKLKLALVAGDASRNSLNKVLPLLAARKVVVIENLTSADLATISGRVSVSAIGIIDTGLAKGIRSALMADG